MSGDGTTRKLVYVDQETKEWIDVRAGWILAKFGWERVESCDVVLPTDEFFPATYSDLESGARHMLDQLCRYLEIPPETVTLKWSDDDDSQTAPDSSHHELTEHPIWIDAAYLQEEPLATAAAMATQLCMLLLLAVGRLQEEEEDDLEPLSYLLTVFLGLGVLTSGCVVHYGGYLSIGTYGYALALFAHIRHESKPTWEKHLHPDVRSTMRLAGRHFEEFDVPELHTVRDTDALPSIPTLSEPEEMRVASDRSTLRCLYCRTTVLSPSDLEDGVCTDCRDSIAENSEEVDAERQEERRGNQSFLWWSLAAVVVAILARVIWNWLR